MEIYGGDGMMGVLVRAGVGRLGVGGFVGNR